MITSTLDRFRARARAISIVFMIATVGALQSSASAQLFVLTGPPGPYAGSYSATTGAAIDADLVSGITGFHGIAVRGNTLYLATDGGAIGTYDATTGAPINPSLITGLALPYAFEISGNTLYVAGFTNDVISTYDATTGATLNASFITTDNPVDLLIRANTLYVANSVSAGYVGAYDATTGATISTTFITGLAAPTGLALVGNRLFVANRASGGYIGEYDATTGAVLNSLYLLGVGGVWDIEALGDLLYVTNDFVGNVGLYDVSDMTAGTPIDTSFITGLNGPVGLAFSVPEPATAWLAICGLGLVAGGIGVRRVPKRVSRVTYL